MSVGPSRALRRLIAEIATVPADDRQAILDELEPELRSRAASLLGALQPVAPGAPAQAAAEPNPWPAPVSLAPVPGLSPWLQRTLESARRGDFGGACPTAATQEALMACAAELAPEAEALRPPPPARPAPSWSWRSLLMPARGDL